MRAGQTLYDNNNHQVALFPLSGFHISQRDDETYSHNPSVYWATDYLGWNSNGRVYRDPCYAPVDIKCIWLNRTECCAVWESLAPVHLVKNDMIDYLTILVYHDNDIANGITQVGTIKYQGEQFNRTGTGGNVTGDHMHLETGYGKYDTSTSSSYGTAEYKYHITDWTKPKRLHNYEALFINDTTPYQSPGNYVWTEFTGGHPGPEPTPTPHKYGFKWVLYANKLRNKN